MNIVRRAAYLAARAYWIVFRPLTLGVRVLIVRGDEVLLIQHSYQPGWFIPGGLVERGEALEQAARREAREEVGAELGSLALVGVYSNYGEGKSDHITLFASAQATLIPRTNPEIDEARFFRHDLLPADTSPGTRRRIETYFSGKPAPGYGRW